MDNFGAVSLAGCSNLPLGSYSASVGPAWDDWRQRPLKLNVCQLGDGTYNIMIMFDIRDHRYVNT